MARKNKKGSSLMGLGLEPEEDKKIMATVKAQDKSVKQLIRSLLREWLKTQK
jgi:Holliday junction resolvasome RuvABC DNA-binding subunit